MSSNGGPFTEPAGSQQRHRQQQQQQETGEEDKEEEKKSLSHEEYLRRHGLDVYLRDSWRLVLVSRTNAEPPRLTLAKYFQSVVDGTNVVGREYAYVASTRRNRLAFLRHLHRTLWDTYRNKRVCLEDFLFLVRRVCRDFPVGLLSDISQIARLECAAATLRPASSESGPASFSAEAADGNFSSQGGSNSRGTYVFSALLRTLSLYMLHPDLADTLLKHEGPVHTLLQRCLGSAKGAHVRQGRFERGEDSTEQHFRQLIRCRLQSFATQHPDIVLNKTPATDADVQRRGGASAAMPVANSLSSSEATSTPSTTLGQPQINSGRMLFARFVGSELFENHLLEEIAATHEQALCASRPGIGSYANDFGLGASKTATSIAIPSDAKPLITPSSNGGAKPVHSRLTRGKPDES